ncbi:hypothetical protein [Cognatitamlana onchidii]|nr:hypothetical protein [Algibacter onchidii]
MNEQKSDLDMVISSEEFKGIKISRSAYWLPAGKNAIAEHVNDILKDEY